MILFDRRFEQTRLVAQADIPPGASLVFEGRADITGLTRLFVSVRDQAVAVAHEIAELFGSPNRVSVPGLDPLAVSSLLGRHLLPLPATAFEGIQCLNYGDRVTVHESGGTAYVVVNEDYPFFEKLNTGSSIASVDTLLAHLTRATERQLEERDTVLLLSSGKDSVSLVLALVELGIQNQVTAVTYANTSSSDESIYAADLCRRFGIRHQTIVNDPGSPSLRDHLIRSFQQIGQPSMDRVMVPMVQLVDTLGCEGVNIVDGSGSDLYVGNVPSRNWLIKRSFSRFSRLSNLVAGRLLPLSSPYRWLLLNQAEICLEDTNLMGPELRKLLADPRDPAPFWASLVTRHQYHDLFDFKAYVSGKRLGSETYMAKTRNVADLTRSHVVFPWCDDDLVHYYFNLPRDQKYDRENLVNKRLVRQMLREKLDYPDQEIGKRAFIFDVDSFYRAHKDWILEEIMGCSLYSDSGRRFVEGLRRSDPNEAELVTLLMLFQLAGWANHSRYLNPIA